MNDKEDKSPESKNPEVLKCEDIQSVLFAYMTRDLGEARSDLVHEHLRKCEKCQAAAAEIKEALDLIGRASRDETGVAERLTEKRRARVLRAFMHPVLDWIYVHHKIVSFIVMVITLVLATYIVCHLKVWKREPLGPIIEVWINKNKPPPWERDRERRTEDRGQKSEGGNLKLAQPEE